MVDLRWYLKELEKRGELLEINEEFDWNYEMAAIQLLLIRASDPEKGMPVLHFKNITGYPTEGPEAKSLLLEPWTGSWKRIWRRVAMGIGLDPDIDWYSYQEFIADKLGQKIKPLAVGTGLVKEHIHLGKDVNIFEFPFAHIHVGDGGRYADMQCIVAKDPDSEWVNWSNYRLQPYTKTKFAAAFTPGQQTANIFYYKYEPRNMPMPLLAIEGGDPAVFLTSGFFAPPGVSEVDVAGALRGAPLELVKAETQPLYTVSDAEWTIEGEIRPKERLDEGPFGEYIGYIHGPKRPMPVFRITAITHRDAPITYFTNEGTRLNQSTTCSSAMITVGLYQHFTKVMRWPVTAVFSPPHLPWTLYIIATHVPYKGYVHDIGQYIFTFGPSAYFDFLVFLDADVDITDLGAVLREIGTKAHPKRDFHNIESMKARPEAPKSHLNVYLSPEEKKAGVAVKCYIDATTKEWDEAKYGPKDLSTKTLYPRDLEVLVEKVKVGR